MLNDPILIRNLQLKNRLVMPPMQSNITAHALWAASLGSSSQSTAASARPAARTALSSPLRRTAASRNTDGLPTRCMRPGAGSSFR